MKRWLSLLLALSLTACGSTSAPASGSSGEEGGETVELIVFAAASMQETLEEIAACLRRDTTDFECVEEIMALLADLAVSERRSFLMVTHDIAISAAVCQRLVVMDAGHIIEEGSAADILSHPQTDLARRLVLAATDLRRYWAENRD